MEPDTQQARTKRLAPLVQVALAALVAGSLFAFSAIAFRTGFSESTDGVTAAVPDSHAGRGVVLPQRSPERAQGEAPTGSATVASTQEEPPTRVLGTRIDQVDETPDRSPNRPAITPPKPRPRPTHGNEGPGNGGGSEPTPGVPEPPPTSPDDGGSDGGDDDHQNEGPQVSSDDDDHSAREDEDGWDDRDHDDDEDDCDDDRSGGSRGGSGYDRSGHDDSDNDHGSGDDY